MGVGWVKDGPGWGHVEEFLGHLTGLEEYWVAWIVGVEELVDLRRPQIAQESLEDFLPSSGTWAANGVQGVPVGRERIAGPIYDE